jgi:hypothetical protein
MALTDVIDQYVTAFGAMTGLQKCYSDPPEAMTEFPCAIVYVTSGEMSVGSQGAVSFHMVNLEIHHSRQILPDAVDAAKVWPERVLHAIHTNMVADRFGGEVSAIRYPLTYDALALMYANETHYGMRFRIDTKIITDPSVSV